MRSYFKFLEESSVGMYVFGFVVLLEVVDGDWLVGVFGGRAGSGFTVWCVVLFCV